MTEHARFRRVATERIDDGIAGMRYGTSPRVLMRSPTHLMYVALGVHVVPRGARSMQHVTRVAGKATREAMREPGARVAVIRAFGVGADDAAIGALGSRGDGTVLVDGGGSVIARAADMAAVVRAAYQAVSPDAKDLMTISAQCRQCGAPLTPMLDHHHFDTPPEAGQARTVDDCRRLSNMSVMSVKGYGAGSPEEWWPYVSGFTTWDGSTYRDAAFCSDACAARYGRRAASELPALSVGGQPSGTTTTMGQHVSHRTRKTVVLPCGLRI